MRGSSVDRAVFHIDHDKVQQGLSQCLDNLDRRNGRDNTERRVALVPDLSQSRGSLPPSLMPPAI